MSRAPEPLVGAVVGGYFPNWASYHDPKILERLLSQARSLTHIFVGFQTISYSPSLDAYYVDFSDPWADLMTCPSSLGLSSEECSPGVCHFLALTIGVVPWRSEGPKHRNLQ